jgi:hypothetical protein
MKSNLNVTPIFSSFLATGYLNVDHEKVMNWIHNKEISEKNFSEENKMRLTLDEKEMGDVYAEISDVMNELHINLELSSRYKQELYRGWVNTGWGFGMGVSHKHTNSTFVSVYYPYVEDTTSAIEFVNPNPSLTWVFPSGESNSVIDRFNIYNSNRWRVEPKTGLIVIFPSWVEHYVLPFTGVRYSIAINSRFTPHPH